MRGLVELRRAANVERTHGQLRARLTDGLRSDNAHSFTDIHRRTASKVTAIAGRANALFGFADQRRADLGRLDFSLLDRFHHRLIDERTSRHDHFTGRGVDDILGHGATQNTLTQRCNHRTTLNDRAHFERVGRFAVLFDDDAILRHVDQTAGEVARVRGLQRGVREALTSAVGRVEVLKNVEAFLEVRDDRVFDDLARRLGHKTTHTRQLLHLRWRTTRARVAHHVDRVDLGFLAVVVNGGRLNALHHRVGHLVTAFGPGVDHLVVLLLLRDETVLVLLLVIGDQRLAFGHKAFLGVGDDHVILTERDAGLERVAEAQRHDGVGEQHRVLLAGVTVHFVDNVTDILLGQKAIDDVIRHFVVRRQTFTDQHTAGRRDKALHLHLAIFVGLRDAGEDLGVERNRLALERLVHFGHIGKARQLLFFGAVFVLEELRRFLLTLHRKIVDPQHHILRRHDDRLAVGGREDVVGRHHQHARFKLRFQ